MKHWQKSALHALFSIVVFACGGDDGDTDNGGETGDMTGGETGDMTGGETGDDPMMAGCPEIAGDPNGGAVGASHSGVIALTEVSYSNPELISLGGSQIAFGWTDDATDVVAPVEGFPSNIGGCEIKIFDAATDSLPTPTDEGDVTLLGTAHGPLNCSFEGGQYVCSGTDDAARGMVPAGSTAQYESADTVTYTIMGADFSNIDMAGMSLTIDGFDDASASGTFPIISDDDGSSLQVGVLGAAPTLDAAVVGTPGNYSTTAGLSPLTPGGFDFLDDGTEDIFICKGAFNPIGAFEVSLNANGEGMTLLEGSHPVEGGMGNFYLPHQIATDGTAVNLGCGSDGSSSCGNSTGNGVLNGVTISGRTTDASVIGLPANAMPEAVGSFATFSCSAFEGGDNFAGFATLSAEAMEAILGTSPTRIQVSVTFASGLLIAPITLAGHNVTGWTTLP